MKLNQIPEKVPSASVERYGMSGIRQTDGST